jgi:hypothetical protein
VQVKGTDCGDPQQDDHSGSTTAVPIQPSDANNRRGMVMIISNPHSEQRHLLLGGPNLTATTNIGLELTPSASLYLDFPLRYDDVLYAIAQSGTSLSFYVMEVGV